MACKSVQPMQSKNKNLTIQSDLHFCLLYNDYNILQKL